MLVLIIPRFHAMICGMCWQPRCAPGNSWSRMARTRRVSRKLYIGWQRHLAQTEWCDVYVTPTGIIATVYHHGEHRTRIQRIIRSGVDLSRVAGVLEVSRAASALTPQQARERLEQVATQPRLYGRWLTTAAVGVACACPSTLFGGAMLEWLITFIAAALAFLARDWMHHHNVSRPLMAGIAAFLAAGIAHGLALLFSALFAAQAISASVLFLVPGVPLVSAMVDLFRGDTVSGVARLASAMLMIVAISAGVWALLLVTQAQMNLDPGRLDVLLLAVPPAFLIGLWLCDYVRRAAPGAPDCGAGWCNWLQRVSACRTYGPTHWRGGISGGNNNQRAGRTAGTAVSSAHLDFYHPRFLATGTRCGSISHAAAFRRRRLHEWHRGFGANNNHRDRAGCRYRHNQRTCASGA